MNVGVLLRGKSLQRANLISDKFDECYIANNFREELKIVGPHLRNKHIVHFVNSMRSAALSAEQYDRFGIGGVQFSFTRAMFERKRGRFDIVKFYNSRGVGEASFLPDKYEQVSLSISNTGVCCIFFVSEGIVRGNIWIAGLDFYRDDYLVKDNADHHLTKSNKIGLIDSFVSIVRDHPGIHYHLVTNYNKLPKLDNLEVL